ncbi:MAG: dihydrodipicolinate synthase family protein [Actinomycetota bacterium]|nr:dihydrodipicolinate synthase family protein [Actinomycetota bacterium]
MTGLARGLWVVLATPYDDAGAVDDESLVRQVRLAERVGASGLVALGVFGEAAALSSAERAQVLRTVNAATSLPVVAGLPARTTAVAIEQAEQAVAGAALAAVMIQANSPSPVVVAAHLRGVHEATGVAVVLQDYPVASGVAISPAHLVEVVEDCPFVVAVKGEASPSAPAAAAVAGQVDVPVFGGLGGVGLLDELAGGAAGAMTGFSHPEGLRATLAAWEAGGFAAARAAWAPWLPLANFEGQAGIGLALRKEILLRRGIIASARVRPPAPGVPPVLLPMIDQHLATVPQLQEAP